MSKYVLFWTKMEAMPRQYFVFPGATVTLVRLTKDKKKEMRKRGKEKQRD